MQGTLIIIESANKSQYNYQILFFIKRKFIASDY